MSYIILGLGTWIAAMFFYSATQSDYHRYQWRTRIARGWYGTQQKMQRGGTQDKILQDVLRQSGLNLSPAVYRLFRLSITFVSLLGGVIGAVMGQYMMLLSPLFIWFVLDYRRPFPMFYAFQGLQKQAMAKREQDLYLLYRLLFQQILVIQQQSINIADMLKRQIDRVPSLRPSLQNCLDGFVDNPVQALHQFGEDVGSKQARTLAHMLIQMHEGGVLVALDLFENNHESFRTDRISSFRTKLNTRALVGTGLTLLGLGAVSFDINVIIQMYSNILLQSTLH